MSRRTSEANKAVASAWLNEKQLVLEGKGTRDWTPEQQSQILEKGKVYDENGRAFEGHHMKSVESYYDYQGDSRNIQFLSRVEHLDAHSGHTHNTTNGYYNPITGETTVFAEDSCEPCEVLKLSEPIAQVEQALAINNETNHGISEAVRQAEKAERFHERVKGYLYNVRLGMLNGKEESLPDKPESRLESIRKQHEATKAEPGAHRMDKNRSQVHEI